MQYILTDKTLTVVLDGKPRSLHRGECGEVAWDKAMEALKADDIETLRKHIDVGSAVNKHFGREGVEIVDGVLYYRGEVLDTYPARKAVEFVKQNLPHEPLINFLSRMETNPSYRARQELYGFLEANNMPLTPEGRFLAYKKVKKVQKTSENEEPVLNIRESSRQGVDAPVYTFVDIHTGEINNNPGTTVRMPRNRVDEDPARTCSHGLHVCSYQYLPSFGGSHWNAVVAVEVDPADVVAVPHDYHNAKMRVCKYRVLEEIEYEGRESQHYWGDRPVVDDYVLESRGDEHDSNLEAEIEEAMEKFQELYPEGDRVNLILRNWLRDLGHGLKIAPTKDLLRDLLDTEGKPLDDVLEHVEEHY